MFFHYYAASQGAAKFECCQRRILVLERKSNRLQKLYKTASAFSSTVIHAILKEMKEMDDI